MRYISAGSWIYRALTDTTTWKLSAAQWPIPEDATIITQAAGQYRDQGWPRRAGIPWPSEIMISQISLARPIKTYKEFYVQAKDIIEEPS